MFKTLTSFFRFYYYMIKGSPKKYDIAMDASQGTATAMTPLIGFLGFVFFSMIFLNPLYGMTFPLAIPVILGNMFIVHKVRDEGYAIQRKLREEKREAERQERMREEAIRRAKERARQQAEWERVQREWEELFERLRRARQQQQQSHSERHHRQQQNIQNQNMINAMKLLGLSKGFTEKDVKKAYRRLSKIHHPDVGGKHENFVKLNKAYNFIMERI